MDVHQPDLGGADVVIVGVDADTADHRAAEDLLAKVQEVLRPADPIGCTHVVRIGAPHTCATLAWDDDGPGSSVAAQLLDALPSAGVAVAGAGQPLLLDGDPRKADGAAVALVSAALRSDGRMVSFTGRDTLRGTLTVAGVTGRSVVDDVVALDGATLPSDARVDTRGFVRPLWRDGRAVLVVEPGSEDTWVPFEQEHPHECCTDVGTSRGPARLIG